MSNFFEQLEAQLQAAARAQTSGRQRRTRATFGWVRLGARALPALLAIALTAAVAAVILTIGSAHHPSAPGPPSPGGPHHGGELAYLRAHYRSELPYLRAADRRALRSKACTNRGPALPRVSGGSPPRALLSTLPVLRRAEMRADTLPAGLRNNDGGFYAGIYVKYARLARVIHGVSYYLVPVEYLNPFPRPLLASCYQAMVTALRAELPRIPPRLRARTLSLQAQLIARQRRNWQHLQQATGPGVCLMYSNAYGSGAFCGTTRQIQQTGLINCCGLLSGVVPDGVATVTLRYPASRGTVAPTATSRVVENVFVTALSLSNLRLSNPRTVSPMMIWRSAQGKIIKTIPATGSHRALGPGFCNGSCGRHRVPR